MSQITAELIRQGAQLRADGEDLTIRAPKGAALPERGRLVELKAELLSLLRNLSAGPRIFTAIILWPEVSVVRASASAGQRGL